MYIKLLCGSFIVIIVVIPICLWGRMLLDACHGPLAHGATFGWYDYSCAHVRLKVSNVHVHSCSHTNQRLQSKFSTPPSTDFFLVPSELHRPNSVSVDGSIAGLSKPYSRSECTLFWLPSPEELPKRMSWDEAWGHQSNIVELSARPAPRILAIGL